MMLNYKDIIKMNESYIMYIRIINKLSILFFLIAHISNAQAIDPIEPMIAAGGYYSLFLTEEGQVWQWGGSFTENDKMELPTPRHVTPLDNITAISAGRYFSLALDQNNQVWAWGSNNHGQLGNGDISYNDPVPALIHNLSDIISIKAGWFHGLALHEEGTLWAWGQNEDGQLGDGTRTTRTTPVQVKELTQVILMAGGRNHSLALTDNGKVWAWGANTNGQLGDGSYTDSNIPVQVKEIDNIVAIAATRDHSLALTEAGTVWAWGNNSSGELGNGTEVDSNVPVKVKELTKIITISADGWDHALAVTETGDVWAWGSNQYGKLGDGTEENRNIPVKVNNVGNIKAIATGWGHSLALTKTNQVWAWGNNDHDQLGNPTTGEYSTTPVLVQDIALNKPIHCETGCEAGKPCVCFNTDHPFYHVNEQLTLSLTLDTNQVKSNTALDLYVILGLQLNEQPYFLFLTQDKNFTPTPIPYDTDLILLQSEELPLLDMPVTSCMGGEYTLYAAFVNHGDEPTLKNVVSNLATYQTVLEDICPISEGND